MIRPLRVHMSTTAVFCCIAFCQTALAQVPAIESFDNDIDAWTPGGSPNYDPFADPNFEGGPPQGYVWEEMRTNGAGVIEEVPSGFGGATSPRGAASNPNFGVVYFEGSNGVYGRPAFQQSPLTQPWSYQMDLYIDPAYAPTLGVGGGDDGNGSNGAADFLWTNGVHDNQGGADLAESGFYVEILDDGVSPRFWRILTSGGALDVETGRWVTLELEFKENTANGKLTAEHKIYNEARTELLYSHTPDHMSLNPNFIDLGGPSYSRFTNREANVPRVLIDEIGVGTPITLPPSLILGDMDGDGDRDNFDIDDFELALTNPTAYLIAHPTLTDYQG